MGDKGLILGIVNLLSHYTGSNPPNPTSIAFLCSIPIYHLGNIPEGKNDERRIKPGSTTKN